MQSLMKKSIRKIISFSFLELFFHLSCFHEQVSGHKKYDLETCRIVGCYEISVVPLFLIAFRLVAVQRFVEEPRELGFFQNSLH